MSALSLSQEGGSQIPVNSELPPQQHQQLVSQQQGQFPQQQYQLQHQNLAHSQQHLQPQQSIGATVPPSPPPALLYPLQQSIGVPNQFRQQSLPMNPPYNNFNAQPNGNAQQMPALMGSGTVGGGGVLSGLNGGGAASGPVVQYGSPTVEFGGALASPSFGMSGGASSSSSAPPFTPEQLGVLQQIWSQTQTPSAGGFTPGPAGVSTPCGSDTPWGVATPGAFGDTSDMTPGFDHEEAMNASVNTVVHQVQRSLQSPDDRKKLARILLKLDGSSSTAGPAAALDWDWSETGRLRKGWPQIVVEQDESFAEQWYCKVFTDDGQFRDDYKLMDHHDLFSDFYEHVLSKMRWTEWWTLPAGDKEAVIETNTDGSCLFQALAICAYLHESGGAARVDLTEVRWHDFIEKAGTVRGKLVEAGKAWLSKMEAGERLRFFNEEVDEDQRWREEFMPDGKDSPPEQGNRVTDPSKLDSVVEKYFAYMEKPDTFGTRFQLRTFERSCDISVFVWKSAPGNLRGVFELQEVFNKEKYENGAYHLFCDLKGRHYEVFIVEEYTQAPLEFEGLQNEDMVRKFIEAAQRLLEKRKAAGGGGADASDGQVRKTGRNGKYDVVHEKKFIFGAVPVYNSQRAGVSEDTRERPWLLQALLTLHRLTAEGAAVHSFTSINILYSGKCDWHFDSGNVPGTLTQAIGFGQYKLGGEIEIRDAEDVEDDEPTLLRIKHKWTSFDAYSREHRSAPVIGDGERITAQLYVHSSYKFLADKDRDFIQNREPHSFVFPRDNADAGSATIFTDPENAPIFDAFRKHQQAALLHCENGFLFRKDTELLLEMCTGSGKTAVELAWLAMRARGGVGVFVSSLLDLVHQPFDAYCRNRKGEKWKEPLSTALREFQWVFFCSENAGGNYGPEERKRIAEEEKITVYWKKPSAKKLNELVKKGGSTMIPVTYHSLKQLKEVLKECGLTISAMVFDEAHNAIGKKEDAIFGKNGICRLSKQSLFCTATAPNALLSRFATAQELADDSTTLAKVYTYDIAQAVEDEVCRPFENFFCLFTQYSAGEDNGAEAEEDDEDEGAGVLCGGLTLAGEDLNAVGRKDGDGHSRYSRLSWMQRLTRAQWGEKCPIQQQLIHGILEGLARAIAIEDRVFPFENIIVNLFSLQEAFHFEAMAPVFQDEVERLQAASSYGEKGKFSKFVFKALFSGMVADERRAVLEDFNKEALGRVMVVFHVNIIKGGTDTNWATRSVLVHIRQRWVDIAQRAGRLTRFISYRDGDTDTTVLVRETNRWLFIVFSHYPESFPVAYPRGRLMYMIPANLEDIVKDKVSGQIKDSAQIVDELATQNSRFGALQEALANTSRRNIDGTPKLPNLQISFPDNLGVVDKARLEGKLVDKTKAVAKKKAKRQQDRAVRSRRGAGKALENLKIQKRAKARAAARVSPPAIGMRYSLTYGGAFIGSLRVSEKKERFIWDVAQDAAEKLGGLINETAKGQVIAFFHDGAVNPAVSTAADGKKVYGQYQAKCRGLVPEWDGDVLKKVVLVVAGRFAKAGTWKDAKELSFNVTLVDGDPSASQGQMKRKRPQSNKSPLHLFGDEDSLLGDDEDEELPKKKAGRKSSGAAASSSSAVKASSSRAVPGKQDAGASGASGKQRGGGPIKSGASAVSKRGQGGKAAGGAKSKDSAASKREQGGKAAGGAKSKGTLLPKK